jgi:hypothetical protein
MEQHFYRGRILARKCLGTLATSHLTARTVECGNAPPVRRPGAARRKFAEVRRSQQAAAGAGGGAKACRSSWPRPSGPKRTVAHICQVNGLVGV